MQAASPTRACAERRWNRRRDANGPRGPVRVRPWVRGQLPWSEGGTPVSVNVLRAFAPRTEARAPGRWNALQSVGTNAGLGGKHEGVTAPLERTCPAAQQLRIRAPLRARAGSDVGADGLGAGGDGTAGLGLGGGGPAGADALAGGRRAACRGPTPPSATESVTAEGRPCPAAAQMGIAPALGLPKPLRKGLRRPKAANQAPLLWTGRHATALEARETAEKPHGAKHKPLVLTGC